MKIKANQTTTIDYLGVFYEGTETELTEYAIGFYEFSRGIPLTQDALPEGVQLLDGTVHNDPVNVEGFEDVPHTSGEGEK
jgi:hypothetical protein